MYHHSNANIPRVSIEVHMGIFTGKNNLLQVILLRRGLGLQLQIRASPKNKT